MTIIAERIPGTWFDRLTMTGHPELVEGCRNVCANNYVVMYSFEIDQIVRQLPQMRLEDDAIQAVSMVMSSAFEKEKFTPEKCTVVGKELFARCKEEGLIR